MSFLILLCPLFKTHTVLPFLLHHDHYTMTIIGGGHTVKIACENNHGCQGSMTILHLIVLGREVAE